MFDEVLQQVAVVSGTNGNNISHSMATPDVGYVRIVMCDIFQSTLPRVSL